jgi:hypothetical protein
MNAAAILAKRPDVSHIQFLERWMNRFTWGIIIVIALDIAAFAYAGWTSQFNNPAMYASGLNSSTIVLSKADSILKYLAQILESIFIYLALQAIRGALRYLVAYRQEIQSKKAKPAGSHA